METEKKRRPVNAVVVSRLATEVSALNDGVRALSDAMDRLEGLLYDHQREHLSLYGVITRASEVHLAALEVLRERVKAEQARAEAAEKRLEEL